MPIVDLSNGVTVKLETDGHMILATEFGVLCLDPESTANLARFMRHLPGLDTGALAKNGPILFRLTDAVEKAIGQHIP
jgi:hypothetical protein